MMQNKTDITKLFLFLLTVTSIFISCKKTLPEQPVEYKKSNGVFICNEGNFTYGNASLSFYEPETNTVENDIFYNTNNFPPGDVAMSMAIKDTSAYLVVNNSGKILVINTNTFKYSATISGLTSPRYILFISDTKAYVTDLYNKNIAVINPKTFTQTGSVFIGNGSEQIVKYQNFAFTVGWSFNNKVYKINTDNDKLTDSLTVTKQPNSIVLDKNNKLWVLSDGGFSGIPGGQEIPSITKIDAETFTIEKEYTFSSVETSPARLTINGTKDTLYFLNSSPSGGNESEGIYRMPVNSDNLPDVAFIPQGDKLFYGLGIDPATSDIYVSDAIDYLQKGIVYHYKSDGTIINTFKTGIIPSYFCFKPSDK
ncbi:MAG: YncE family protein [Chlorobi bacterium]|nr:YncE family protein [Chlorobiota bacterium]